MTEYYSLTFQPGGLKILDVPRGESILRAAMQANVHINASCGGAGSCGKCRIKLISGEAEGKPSAKLSEEQFAEGYRLACRTKVTSDMEIFIPEESRMGAGDVLELSLIHISEPTRLRRISYAVFCLNKKKKKQT